MINEHRLSNRAVIQSIHVLEQHRGEEADRDIGSDIRGSERVLQLAV